MLTSPPRQSRAKQAAPGPYGRSDCFETTALPRCRLRWCTPWEPEEGSSGRCRCPLQGWKRLCPAGSLQARPGGLGCLSPRRLAGIFSPLQRLRKRKQAGGKRLAYRRGAKTRCDASSDHTPCLAVWTAGGRGDPWLRGRWARHVGVGGAESKAAGGRAAGRAPSCWARLSCCTSEEDEDGDGAGRRVQLGRRDVMCTWVKDDCGHEPYSPCSDSTSQTPEPAVSAGTPSAEALCGRAAHGASVGSGTCSRAHVCVRDGAQGLRGEGMAACAGKVGPLP